MFPKISDLISFLFNLHINLPFQTYGFMLTLAFLTGGVVLRSELKRKEKEGLLVARIRPIEPSRQAHWFNIFIQGVIVFVGITLYRHRVSKHIPYGFKEEIIHPHQNSNKNVYIQKAMFNGKELNNFWFTHEEFARGGSLEIWLGNKPNTSWGVNSLPPEVK